LYGRETAVRCAAVLHVRVRVLQFGHNESVVMVGRWGSEREPISNFRCGLYPSPRLLLRNLTRAAPAHKQVPEHCLCGGETGAGTRGCASQVPHVPSVFVPTSCGHGTLSHLLPLCPHACTDTRDRLSGGVCVPGEGPGPHAVLMVVFCPRTRTLAPSTHFPLNQWYETDASTEAECIAASAAFVATPGTGGGGASVIATPLANKVPNVSWWCLRWCGVAPLLCCFAAPLSGRSRAERRRTLTPSRPTSPALPQGKLAGASSVTFRPHGGAVTALAFSPFADAVLAVGAADGGLKLCGLGDGGAEVGACRPGDGPATPGAVTALAFHPHADGLLAAGYGKATTVAVWDAHRCVTCPSVCLPVCLPFCTPTCHMCCRAGVTACDRV
jgi:hypothetical protein